MNRRTRPQWWLALALVGGLLSSATPCRAQGAAPADAPSPQNLDAFDAPTGRVKFQALGAGFHTTMFATEARYGYTLMGPSLTYQYFVGRRWGFALRGEIYFPMSGRYAGPEANFRTGLRSPYEATRIGIDGTLGVARRLPFTASASALVGFGVHVQSFKLAGTQYAPIEGITGGFGGFARVDWRVHSVVSLGAEVALAIDPLDFVRHRNRAVVTVPLSFALSLAFTYGPGTQP